jgi:DNA-binding NarL/FixJ family response regulator
MTEVWPERLRILIADDHPLFRDGLRMLLSTTDDLEVMAEASSGEEAVELVTRSQDPPDVVLMDLKMPGLSGIEATRNIVSIAPQVHVLVVTMFDDDASVFAAMRAGARGYILKDAAQDDVLRAIRSVGRGEAIFSPSVATRVLESFSAVQQAVPRELFPMLTERERDILSALARGYSNVEIARELQLTPKTVRNYVSAVLSKLQVVDRAEAILRAREAGLSSTRVPRSG